MTNAEQSTDWGNEGQALLWNESKWPGGVARCGPWSSTPWVRPKVLPCSWPSDLGMLVSLAASQLLPLENGSYLGGLLWATEETVYRKGWGEESVRKCELFVSVSTFCPILQWSCEGGSCRSPRCRVVAEHKSIKISILEEITTHKMNISNDS